MYDVNGKTAVITGGASGIGLGMGRAFASAGMSLVLADIEEDRLDEVVQRFTAEGTPTIGVVTDVSDESQVQALADRAVAEFGAVHVVANNAGIGVGGEVDKLSIDDWRWTLDVNLWGVIHGLRTFLPLLKEQGEGHITATASVAGLLCGPVLGAYHVSKHGVVALMDATRAELEQSGSAVRASVLCPGPVDTDVTDSVRNRPAGLGPHEPTDVAQEFFVGLSAALRSGMPPDQVGELQLEAIQNERFWILTHPEEHIAALEQVRLEGIKRDHAHRL